jgi:hypothetical protein
MCLLQAVSQTDLPHSVEEASHVNYCKAGVFVHFFGANGSIVLPLEDGVATFTNSLHIC